MWNSTKDTWEQNELITRMEAAVHQILLIWLCRKQVLAGKSCWMSKSMHMPDGKLEWLREFS